MNLESPAHFVFVDFENINNVDLAGIGGKSARIALLIGQTSKRPDWSLTQQIHRHASQVELVEAGVSGRNALDLVLAYRLGHTASQHPGAAFHIVSKDKDFDPLISHLRNQGVNVVRHDAFAALPFLTSAIRPTKVMPSTTKTTGTAAKPDERLEKLIDRLQNKPKARPVRRKTLLSHINAFFGHKLSPSELDDIVDQLITRRVIAMNEKDRVEYF